MVNTIKINVLTLDNGDPIVLDGIRFSACSYIDILIDGINPRSFEDFEDMLIVFPELERSAVKEGKYLIFTCACGVADDGGWDYVNVKRYDDCIEWALTRNKEYRYKFDRIQYLSEVEKANREILKLADSTLIPENFINPENI